MRHFYLIKAREEDEEEEGKEEDEEEEGKEEDARMGGRSNTNNSEEDEEADEVTNYTSTKSNLRPSGRKREENGNGDGNLDRERDERVGDVHRRSRFRDRGCRDVGAF